MLGCGSPWGLVWRWGLRLCVGEEPPALFCTVPLGPSTHTGQQPGLGCWPWAMQG